MYQIILLNSSGCELDRKECETPEEGLRELASEGCLGGGDVIRIIDLENGDLDHDD